MAWVESVPSSYTQLSYGTCARCTLIVRVWSWLLNLCWIWDLLRCYILRTLILNTLALSRSSLILLEIVSVLLLRSLVLRILLIFTVWFLERRRFNVQTRRRSLPKICILRLSLVSIVWILWNILLSSRLVTVLTRRCLLSRWLLLPFYRRNGTLVYS